MASRRSPSHPARSFRADPHPPRRAMVCFHGRSIVHRPSLSGDSWCGQVPRVPLHKSGVTSLVVLSGITSAGVTLPSSLLRTPAPILPPPRASVRPSTPGLCRLLSAPAGRRTFPTCSLRLLPCVLGPLPRPLVECLYPFLPPRPRPSPRSDRVGASQRPSSDCSPAPVSRLQSLRHVPAHRWARHPDRSYRYRCYRRAAVPFPSEPLMGCSLPMPRICLPSESGH